MTAADAPKAGGFTPYHFFMLCLSVWALVTIGAGTFLNLNAQTRIVLAFADTAACVIFFLNFLASFYRAPRKLHYMMTWGWIDLLSSIPPIGSLRWGRLILVFRIFRVLSAFKSAQVIGHLFASRRREGAFLASVLVSLLILFGASVAILQVEVAAGSNIRTAHDAMWWAVSMITTVGSGDVYPVTPQGRLIGAGVMAAGVGIFGILSGLAAAWFLAPVEKRDDKELIEIRGLLVDLRTQMAERNNG